MCLPVRIVWQRAEVGQRRVLPRLRGVEDLVGLSANDVTEGKVSDHNVVRALRTLSEAAASHTGVLVYCKRGANRSPMLLALWLVMFLFLHPSGRSCLKTPRVGFLPSNVGPDRFGF